MMLTRLKNGWQWYANPYSFLDRAREQEGMTFRLEMPFLGNVLVTGDPAQIREIAVDRSLHSGKGISALRSILGDRSLITLDGEAHQARRAVVAPCLRGAHLHHYDPLIIQYTLEEIRRIPLRKPFSAYTLTQRISLRVILSLIFGQLDPATATRAQRLIEELLDSFQSALTLFLKPLHVDLGPYSPWGRMRRRREKVIAFIHEQLSSPQPDEHSLLSHLSKADLPVEDIVAEVLALLLFGHDTGAATMAWALTHILSDPTAATRVKQEVSAQQSEGAQPSSTSQQPTNLHLDQIPYLDACLHESMRLRPVVTHVTRVAQSAGTLPSLPGDSVPVAAGDTLLPSTYLAQHNPAIFDDPDCFRPERFLEGATYPHAFFPFGLGARTCIGKPFVEREMRLILATLFRHETLRLAPGYQAEPERRMVLMIPRDGALLVRDSATRPTPLERSQCPQQS